MRIHSGAEIHLQPMHAQKKPTLDLALGRACELLEKGVYIGEGLLTGLVTAWKIYARAANSCSTVLLGGDPHWSSS